MAGHDLILEAGEASEHSEITQKKKRSGTFSSKTKIQRDAFEDTRAQASTFSGDTVALQAGNDLRITGSNVAATNATTLTSGGDLLIESATETHTETHYKKTKESGLFSSGGVGFTIGSKMLSTDQQGTGTSAAASTVGSVEGNVTLQAGEAYRQVGSDVIATTGDIDITAKTVDILEAREQNRTTFETKAKQSGLTVAITSPIISAIQTAQQMSEAAKDTKDSRMQLLAAANVGLSAYSTYDAVKTGQGTTVNDKEGQIVTGKDAQGNTTSRDANAADQVGGINLSVSIGSSSSSSKSTQTSDTAAGSTLQAGGDLTITATGAGEQSDITVRGSDLAAGKNLTLKAEDEIKLLAAANTAEQHSTNKSSSASVGFSVGTNGFLVNVGASAGKGKADGADLAWTNSHATAGETLTLQSGGDTSLKGAVAQGEQVVAKVGGDLSIESLQDQSRYDSKQKSAGFSVSVGAGAMSGSLSYSQSKVESDYASVTEQSGIKAGDAGFQVKVEGDTDLKGAVIASSQRALDEDRNEFETGGVLSTEDIHNHAEYEAKSTSVNIGSSMSFDGKLKPGGTGVGFGKDEDSAESTTKSGISGVAGNTEVRTGDPETGIAKIFDAEKVQKEIEAQTKITQLFGQQASKAVGDYAASQLKAANELRLQGREEEAKAIEALWGETGTLRLAAHTVIGGLTGGASGAAGSLAGTITAPLVAEELAKAGINGNLATALTALASTAVGGAVGGSTGAGTALNEVANNYLSHDQINQKRKELASCKSVADCKAVEEKWEAIDQKQTIDAITYLANGTGASVMMTTDALKQIRDQLQKDCAVFCSADSLSSLNELNGYFLPNGDINQEALRTGRFDLNRFVKSGINLAGSVAGVGTGVILTATGGALVLAPEPTGISKPAGALTTATGVATLADSSYGVYSSAVNLYRATQGSVAYLPDGGLGWLAGWIVPENQAAQDMAQIGSLSLALLSGRVYVGTTLRYANSPLAQYMPATIDGMLDAAAAAPSGAFKFALIPTANPSTSTATRFLNITQWAQVLSTDHDLARRLLTSESPSGGGK